MIIERPEHFRPVQAKTKNLEDVKFKFTVVIAVKQAEGQRYTVEAEVDRIVSDNGRGIYQLGSTKVYLDNRTNTRMQVETIDLEK
jgi:hypothetical protein